MSLTRSVFKKIHCHKFMFLSERSFATKSKKPENADTAAAPTKATPAAAAPTTATPASSNFSDVPGLSSKVLTVPNGEVGSGASKNSNYKNPEYFCYHQTSYFDAELEMLKFRVPQPSAGRK